VPRCPAARGPGARSRTIPRGYKSRARCDVPRYPALPCASRRWAHFAAPQRDMWRARLLTRNATPQVPIGASDEVSSAWIQRAFSCIHHPLCTRAAGAEAFYGNTGCSLGGVSRTCGEKRDKGGGTTATAHPPVTRPVDVAGCAAPDDDESRAGSSGCDDKACAQCPEPLLNMFLAVADAESSVLMYLVPRPSHSLL
jgi:hypothetical protein